jgi:hypothetical protein
VLCRQSAKLCHIPTCDACRPRQHLQMYPRAAKCWVWCGADVLCACVFLTAVSRRARCGGPQVHLRHRHRHHSSSRLQASTSHMEVSMACTRLAVQESTELCSWDMARAPCGSSRLIKQTNTHVQANDDLRNMRRSCRQVSCAKAFGAAGNCSRLHAAAAAAGAC